MGRWFWTKSHCAITVGDGATTQIIKRYICKQKSPYIKSFAIPEDHELVDALRTSFHEVTGNELPIDYYPSVCDSNIVAVSLGIPVVTFGPSGGSTHGENEYGYPYQVKNC